MLKRVAFASLLLGSLGAGQSRAQLCTTTHTTDLYCLLPAAFHTTAQPFSAFYAPFGTELSQLPTAKPAGLILKIGDNGVLAPANESLGAVFSERAETIGKNRIFLGFTYQRFNFSTIDGNDLENLPIVLTFKGTATDGTPVSVDTVTMNRIDVKSNQYTLLGTMGVSNRIDVSLSVPFQRIAMAASVSGVEYDQLHQNNSVTLPPVYVPGASFGIGDVILGAKGLVWQGTNVRFAVGTDFRIPSGDELNFLGSGTIGIKPYIAISRRGKVSPHGNVGYQWNGDSILNANRQGQKQQLPTDFFYTVGFDATLKHVTVVADLLGELYFNAPRFSKPVPVSVLNAPGVPVSVVPYIGNYVANNLGLGIKSQVYRHLVVTGNLLIKLDSGGLRSAVVPLAGVSYSF